MKKLYFLVMLSVVFNNVVQAQDTIPEQRVTDPLKVQRNEPVFTDKQLLYINEMALERSEASADRAMDLFSKTIDTIALFFTLFSIGIAILGYYGFSNLKQIEVSRKAHENKLDLLYSQISEKYKDLEKKTQDDNSSISRFIQAKQRIDYIQLKVIEEDYSNSYKLIQESKNIFKDIDFVILQLKILEAKVRVSNKDEDFYDLFRAEELILDVIDRKSEYLTFEILDLLGWINFQQWGEFKKVEYVKRGIDSFQKIIDIPQSEIQEIQRKQTFANIATGYKRLGELELALKNIKQAEDIKDFTNEKLNTYISKFKSQIEHNL